jgi:hypothetical protein
MATPSTNATVTPTATVTALPNASANVQVSPNTFQGPKGDRGEKGERGDIGPRGPAGPSGSGAGGLSLTIPFSNPLLTWNVAHDLNCFPSITVIDTAGDLIEPDIKYVDENTVLVTFSAPTAGTVLIN